MMMMMMTTTQRLCRHHQQHQHHHHQLLALALQQLHQQRRQLFFSWKKPDQHTAMLFGEVNRRGGYPTPYRDSLTTADRLRIARQAWLNMPQSAVQLRDYYLYDKLPFKVGHVRHGDYHYLANFPRDAGHADWVVTADSHYGEGYSRGEFVAGDGGGGTGVFHGELSVAVPQTGQLARAGFVNLRSPYAAMVMGRPRPVRYSPLNCVVIRYRGDGRRYKLNMHRGSFTGFDMALFDLYSYPLYSRGGPYWTVCKIPVSKLVRVYKGRAQDKPQLYDLSSHQHLSITLADGLAGPFRLEIDYIALYYDAHLNERFAYEIYPVSSLMKNNLTY